MPLDTVPSATPFVPVLLSEDRIVAACSRSQMWHSLVTVSPLPRWAPVVRGQSAPQQVPVRPGSSRAWHLRLGRRGVRVIERCIEARDETRLSFLIEPGAGGLAPYLGGLVFAFELEAVDRGQTVLWLRTYYPPAGRLPRLLRAAPLRRKFAALRLVMLRNLRRTGERAAARSPHAPMPWDGDAVVPPVALLMRER